MIKHTFSDFSYAINTTSAKKGYKEIFCCFIYNGTEILRKVYIKESKGTAYIFEAKKIIDQEVRDGSLTIYSRNFIKKHKRVVPTKKSTYAASLVKAGVSDLPKGNGTLKKKKTARKPARKKPVAHKKKAAPKAIAPVIAAAPKKAPAPKKEAPVTEMVSVSDTQSPKNNSGKKWAIAGCVLVAAAGITVGSIFLVKALEKDATKHKITFDGSHYKIHNKIPTEYFEERATGDKIGQISAIIPEEGYGISTEDIKIDAIRAGNYTWEDGIIKFNDVTMPDKDFKITIEPTQVAKITFDGDVGLYKVEYKGHEVSEISLKPGDKIGQIDISTTDAEHVLTMDSISIDPPGAIEKPTWIINSEYGSHGTLSFNDSVMPDKGFKIYITVAE